MNNWLFTFFNYFMILYSAGLILSYFLMTVTSFFQIYKRKKYKKSNLFR